MVSCTFQLFTAALVQDNVQYVLIPQLYGRSWSAIMGIDSKPLRIFNPATQASKFDADGDYIRRWVPELRHVCTKDLLSAEIGALERRGYKDPLVNHKTQQAFFKALFAGIRATDL